MKSYIKKPAFLITLFLATVVITSCCNRACEVPVFGFRVINSYPHDTLAFTEGLSLYNGYIVEGTGIPGYSSLRKYRLKTGDMIDFYSVPDKYFAEGITIFNKKVVQITEDANIWPGSLIACISPTDGRVNRWIDLEWIFDPEEISDESLSELKGFNLSMPVIKEACPNGIAYDPINNRLFVTGKLWPRIFEIEITDNVIPDSK